MDKHNISPMMKHYLTIKEKHPDSIVFYRLGDFYEMFFDDAVLASKLLDLTLTGRDCGLSERAPMCGIPYHAADNYIARLIDKGYRVAICEQLTLPSESKGIVDRDVVRIITPGTVTDENMLNDKRNNYIASIIIDENKLGIAWADISTGEFYTSEQEGNVKILEELISAIRPREIISNEQAYMLSTDILPIRNNEIPSFRCYYNWAYDYNTAVKALLRQFKVQSLDAYEMTDSEYAIGAAGALIEYFNETQKRSLSHINSIQMLRFNNTMVLDSNTRRNLEITETIRERKSKGSLLWLMDHTSTNMGGRLIRKWLEQPLIDSIAINDRLDAVEEMISFNKLKDIIKLLDCIRDIERLSSKLAYGSINPRDLISIGESLEILPQLRVLLSEFKSSYIISIFNDINPLTETVDLINQAIKSNPPALLKDGGYIADGYNNELDELRNIKLNGEKWIANIEATEKQNTGIKSLKISFNRVFGYYIEVPRSYSDKVPYRYIRKQTLANSERYITDELKKIEDKILNSEAASINLELRLFNELRESLLHVLTQLQSNSRAVARCDVICSLASIAINNRYVRPEINDTINHISIKNGRHPVIESMLKTNEYVMNDTLLDDKENSTMVITGPNMAGKSTYMRQVALITLMAHIGSFVSAESASISITDRIFTRVGASDDLSYGHSTFMVEMVETAAILLNATTKSLIVLDEIGRGTSTYDGLSIAWAVMEYINSKVRAKTMFATHYHELTELEGIIEGIKNYRILIKEHKDGIIFLHKISRGGANKSFGIEVASLAGVPQDVIIRARQISKLLEASDINRDKNSIMLNAMGLKDLKQIGLFKERNDSEIINILKDIEIDSISPVQAFMILKDLSEKARNE